MDILNSVYEYIIDYFLEDAYLLALQGVGLLLLFLAVWGTIAYFRQRNYQDYKKSLLTEDLFIARVKRMTEIFRVALLFCMLGVFLVVCSTTAIYCSNENISFDVSLTEILSSVGAYIIFYAYVLIALDVLNLSARPSES